METLKDQLFSQSLLRLWRTGAQIFAYTAEEDIDIDVSSLRFKLTCIQHRIINYYI